MHIHLPKLAIAAGAGVWIALDQRPESDLQNPTPATTSTLRQKLLSTSLYGPHIRFQARKKTDCLLLRGHREKALAAALADAPLPCSESKADCSVVCEVRGTFLYFCDASYFFFLITIIRFTFAGIK